MKVRHFELMANALGINIEHAERSPLKKDKLLPDEFYRNYYYPAGDDLNDWEEIYRLGLANRWRQFGNTYYGVNDHGINDFRKEFTKRITSKYKRKRGKEQY